MKNSYSFLRRTSVIATVLVATLFAFFSCEIENDNEKGEEINKPEVVEQVIGCWHTDLGYQYHLTFYENMTVRIIIYLHPLGPSQSDWIGLDAIMEWETRGDKQIYIFVPGDKDGCLSTGEIRDGRTIGLTVNDPNEFETFDRDSNCSKGPKFPPLPPEEGTINHPDTVKQITGTWRIEEENSYLREIIFKGDMTAEEIKYTSKDHGPAMHYTWKTIDNFLLLFDKEGSKVEVGQMEMPSFIRLNPNKEYGSRDMLKSYEWRPNASAYSMQGTWKSNSEDNRYRLIELECDRENNPTVARLTEADGTVREGHWYEYGGEVRIWFDAEWDRETDLRFIRHQGQHYDVTLRIFPGFGSSEEYYPQQN